VLSDLTPPDAVTAFAAANLSGSEPMLTGVEVSGWASRWLVPFAFVYQPALLLNGSALSIAVSFALTAVGRSLSGRRIIGHVQALCPFSALSSACAACFLCSRP